MEKNLITMTKKELLKYEIIKKLIDGKINGTQASKQLDLSIRQTKRLKQAVIRNGIQGVIHKNRGRESNNKLNEKLSQNILSTITKNYSDFTPAFAQEKLAEVHQIKVSYSTVRKIMIEGKLYRPKKRIRPRYYSQRARKDYLGELVQFDGSYHNWLESRGGITDLCLLASIDDATSKITYAKFDKNESIKSVFAFWQEYLKKNHKPKAIYLDKFSTYKINHKNAVDNQDLQTQFQRAIQELNIKPINAHTPQAKGRVERLFQTLQDRLIKEMRLKNVSDIEIANQYLQTEFIPKFNQRFSVKPKKAGNLHTKLTRLEKKNLNHIFSIKNQRKVRNDFVVQYQNRYFQLDEIQNTTVFRKDSITVERHLDDSIHINKQGKYLGFKELPEKPQKELELKLVAITRKKSTYIPPVNHPWRRFMVNKKPAKIKAFKN